MWFNWYCAEQKAKGLPIPATLSNVPKTDVKAAKAQIAELAQTRFQNLPITIRPTSYTSKKGEVIERLGAFTEQGNLLGLITPDSEAKVTQGQQIKVKFALTTDGNMRVI